MRSVYIETSVVSYLAARPSKNLLAAAWQQVSFDWWHQERHKYALFTSELVIAEASAGDKEFAKIRLSLLKDIPELKIDDEARDLGGRFIEDGVLPPVARGDAIHIAVAAVQKVDFLLTWNCRHIDNAKTKPAVRRLCAALGFLCPEICTPLELRGRRL